MRFGDVIDLNAFRFTSWVSSFLLFLAATYRSFAHDVVGVGILGIYLIVSIFVTSHRYGRLPALFALLFVFSALLNAAGFVWDLYERISFFDELSHFYSSFACTTALGFLLYSSMYERLFINTKNSRRFYLLFLFTLTNIGFTIGVLWEGFEWVVHLLGSVEDTLSDLMLDGAGAICGAWLATKGLEWKFTRTQEIFTPLLNSTSFK
jgi:hypothetical protein